MSWGTGLKVSKYLCVLEAPNEVNWIIAYIRGPWKRGSGPTCKVLEEPRISAFQEEPVDIIIETTFFFFKALTFTFSAHVSLGKSSGQINI